MPQPPRRGAAGRRRSPVVLLAQAGCLVEELDLGAEVPDPIALPEELGDGQGDAPVEVVRRRIGVDVHQKVAARVGKRVGVVHHRPQGSAIHRSDVDPAGEVGAEQRHVGAGEPWSVGPDEVIVRLLVRGGRFVGHRPIIAGGRSRRRARWVRVRRRGKNPALLRQAEARTRLMGVVTSSSKECPRVRTNRITDAAPGVPATPA